MQDFLWAAATKLRQLFPGGEVGPVYFGRLLQGERTPCFYLPPPALHRQLWPCGRVRREIDLTLHYYPRPSKAAAEKPDGAWSGLAEQERIGEGLVRGMAELSGRLRAYRGHDLHWQAGNEDLCFQAKYVYYTTLELEAADKLSLPPKGADLMQFLAIGPLDDTAADINKKIEK